MTAAEKKTLFSEKSLPVLLAGKNCSDGDRNGPWHDEFSLEDRKEKVFKNMYHYHVVRNRPKNCLSNICSKRKRAAWDKVLNPLSYCNPLSRNGVNAGISTCQRKRTSCCEDTHVEKCYRKRKLDRSW